MTIVEFLEARYAEDEAGAYAYRELEPEPGRRFTFTVWPDEQEVDVRFEDGTRQRMPWPDFQEQHMELVLSRPRALAEVDAKRRIVELHEGVPLGRLVGDDAPLRCRGCGYTSDMLAAQHPCPTIMALASVYADHPDYDQAWRP